jgi:competence protein ComEC
MQFFIKFLNFNLPCIAISSLIGINLLQFYYYYQNHSWWCILVILLFFCCVFYKFKQFRWLLLWGITNLLVIVLGLVWMTSHVKVFKSNYDYLSFLVGDGEAIIQGKILSVTKLNNQFRQNDSIQLDLALQQLKTKITNDIFIDISKIKNNYIRLKCFNCNLNSPCVGDVWQLAVKLYKPRTFATPGSFDQEKYLFANRIIMVGKISTKKIHQATNMLINTSLDNYLSKLKHNIVRKILNKLQTITIKYQLKNLPIILMLSLAIKDPNLAQAVTAFQQTGILHLLTISGLHVGLVGGMFFKIINFGWKKLVRIELLEKIPAPIVSAYVSIGIIIGYVYLIGFNIPTVRSLLMSIIYLIGISLRWVLYAKQIYFLTMIVMLITDPFIVLLSGFWLSFVATGILLYAKVY